MRYIPGYIKLSPHFHHLMELYVKISFWTGVVTLFLRVLALSVLTWPRQRNETMGSYVALTLLSLAFTIWAGVVLWVR